MLKLEVDTKKLVHIKYCIGYWEF